MLFLDQAGDLSGGISGQAFDFLDHVRLVVVVVIKGSGFFALLEAVQVMLSADNSRKAFGREARILPEDPAQVSGAGWEFSFIGQ